jgi:hypothetical protein
MTDNFWMDERKRQLEGNDTTLEGMKEKLRFCLDWLSKTKDKEELFHLISITLQLKSSRAILSKLDELKREG